MCRIERSQAIREPRSARHKRNAGRTGGAEETIGSRNGDVFVPDRMVANAHGHAGNDEGSVVLAHQAENAVNAGLDQRIGHFLEDLSGTFHTIRLQRSL